MNSDTDKAASPDKSEHNLTKIMINNGQLKRDASNAKSIHKLMADDAQMGRPFLVSGSVNNTIH